MSKRDDTQVEELLHKSGKRQRRSEALRYFLSLSSEELINGKRIVESQPRTIKKKTLVSDHKNEVTNK